VRAWITALVIERRRIGPVIRALLALSSAGAFRRSELMALQADDLAETPDGLRVAIHRDETDQEGQGAEVAILRGCRLLPVEAVQMSLGAAEICTGPVFRAVALGGKVSDDVALADDGHGALPRASERNLLAHAVRRGRGVASWLCYRILAQ
jgi:hypothetical protein